MKLHGTLLLMLISICANTVSAQQIRRKTHSTIQWIDSTRRFVCPGTYARIRQMDNGDHILAYSCWDSGAEIMYCRISKDQTHTWGEKILVSADTGYNDTNAEIVQLPNGELLYAWNARPQHQCKLPFAIRTKRSRDHGLTWTDERTIYEADTLFRNGVWEPAMLQLPSGELQMYISNESPYRQSDEQDITLLRSFDNGMTWHDSTRVSFRAGHRDGMPTPLYLKGGYGIVFSIEDQEAHFPHAFHPSIIWTSVDDNWHSGTVTGDSPKRWRANRRPIPFYVYAGAPYLAQFPDAETILSCQSTQGRKKTKGLGVMRVYVGNELAHDFSNGSVPFPSLPSSAEALWNSLTILDGNTVIAISSISGTKPEGIWTVIGKKVKK